MKRNESILVYGVTGLLVVILIIAVVFGDQDPKTLLDKGAPASGPAGAGELLEDDDLAAGVAGDGTEVADLEEILNLDPTQRLDGDAPETGGTAPADVEAPTAPTMGGSPAEPAEAAARAGESALAGVAVPQPGAAGTVRLGDYRQVTVQRGDTLSTLVQRWCGSLDPMPLVEALNEDVATERLRVGQTLLLPWVDDEELAEIRKRQPAPADTSSVYTVRSGDSLWKIAVRATGDQRRAPAFVQRIMELNPDLEPERLLVGQEIVLPQDGAGAHE